MPTVRTIRVWRDDTVEIQWTTQNGEVYIERHTIPPRATMEARTIKTLADANTLADAKPTSEAGPFVFFAAEGRELARVHADRTVTYSEGVTPDDVLRFVANVVQALP